MELSKDIGTKKAMSEQQLFNTHLKTATVPYISPMMLYRKIFPSMESIKKETNLVMMSSIVISKNTIRKKVKVSMRVFIKK